MKTSILAACIAVSLFAADANAELYKCVKDGKTSYQEQPCGGQGGTESKIQTSKPSSWTGCFQHQGPAFDKGRTGGETIEVRQEGSTLYTPQGREGPYEQRLLWAPATPKQLGLMRQFIGRNEKDAIEVTSGLVMTGVSTGPEVKTLREDEIIMGYWWIRGLEVEGDPMGHLPRTKETLRASKERLYFTALGLGSFEKAGKVPCPAGK